MKYLVDVNGERFEVDVDGEGVHVNGKPVRARVADVEGAPIHLLTIEQENHRFAARPGQLRGEFTLWMDGFRYSVEALDERSRTIRELTAAAAGPRGPAPLIAPMPGLIVRVRVQEGDSVQVGQGLVVMEAMKMENELRAAGPGRVKSIRVTPGMAVEKGALLIELE